MGFHPNQQLRLLEHDFDPIDTLRRAVTKETPWDSIIEFATSDKYCNRILYPRQQTLLRLIYLETEQMTAFDIDVIEEWRRGFQRPRGVYGVQPDVWERVEYLKRRGYRRFPHIQAVLGRRASKGFIGGLLAVEMIAYLITLDNPQRHYSIDDGKDVFLNVGATSQTQAQRHQFADVRRMVEACKWLHPYIAETKDHQIRLRTPADFRQIAALKAQNVNIEHTIASIWGVALSASSVAGRGATSFANMFDEFAFHVQGSGSVKSGEEIYEDWQPSLGQFKRDALTYVPSSPFCLEPSTRVLTEDLRWVPVETLAVGDHLIGFDEHVAPGRGQSRKWRRATVTETSLIHAPRYAITLESGKRVVCTGEHLWLNKRWSQPVGRGKNRGHGGGQPIKFIWRKTSELKAGDEIKALGVDPWEEDTSKDGGWLAGFFDGEGHYSGTGTQSTLGVGQNEGTTLEKVRRLLKEREFTVVEALSEDDRRTKEHYKLRINGGFPEIMRFLGSVRPERLIPKLASRLYGSRTYSNGGRAVERVVSVERVEDGPVVALGTSTNTLMAESLFSHNTKVGKFYELYQLGSVLMDAYQDETGMTDAAVAEVRSMRSRSDLDEVELKADPTKLIFQGPSWCLYEDWQRSITLVGDHINAAPEDDLNAEEQLRRKLHNPEKFAVEREGQFAEVMGQYLDSNKVEAMFKPVMWREPNELEPTPFGRFDYTYRIHVDPSKTGANFALAIAHTEIAPCDKCGATPTVQSAHQCIQMDAEGNRCPGQHWPHVIMDRLKVWRAMDFPINPETEKHEIDYTVVEAELDEVLYTFPSTSKFTADQWNSVGFLQRLAKKYSPRIRVLEATATEKENWSRAERFKSAINLGWVHSFRDDYGVLGACLLEDECKFLSEKNGKVYKQEFGPVQTKDLYDSVSTIVTDLLAESLERWDDAHLNAHSFGSTNVAAVKSGRAGTSQAMADSAFSDRPRMEGIYQGGVHGQNSRVWDQINMAAPNGRRSQYSPGRNRSTGMDTRGRRRY